MLREITSREHGLRKEPLYSCKAANISLVQRLQEAGTLNGSLDNNATSSTTCCSSFSNDGRFMLSGSEDAVLKIWDLTSTRKATRSFDSGHTSSIFVARFMPDTSNKQIATCSGDRQVRIIDLNRLAVRPFVCHRSRVKALAPISNSCIISGGEDGTVRKWDMREPTAPSAHVLQTRSLLVEQRSERSGRSGLRVAVNSVAVDPLQPHIFATGGSDPLVRVYDMRMLQKVGGMGTSRVSQTPWLYCLVPEHLKGCMVGSASWQAPMHRVRSISSIAFTSSGHEIVASYSSERIYSFGCREHARTYEGLFCTGSGDEQGAMAAAAQEPLIEIRSFGAPGELTESMLQGAIPGQDAAVGSDLQSQGGQEDASRFGGRAEDGDLAAAVSNFLQPLVPALDQLQTQFQQLHNQLQELQQSLYGAVSTSHQSQPGDSGDATPAAAAADHGVMAPRVASAGRRQTRPDRTPIGDRGPRLPLETIGRRMTRSAGSRQQAATPAMEACPSQGITAEETSTAAAPDAGAAPGAGAVPGVFETMVPAGEPLSLPSPQSIPGRLGVSQRLAARLNGRPSNSTDGSGTANIAHGPVHEAGLPAAAHVIAPPASAPASHQCPMAMTLVDSAVQQHNTQADRATTTAAVEATAAARPSHSRDPGYKSQRQAKRHRRGSRDQADFNSVGGSASQYNAAGHVSTSTEDQCGTSKITPAMPFPIPSSTLSAASTALPSQAPSSTAVPSQAPSSAVASPLSWARNLIHWPPWGLSVSRGSVEATSPPQSVNRGSNEAALPPQSTSDAGLANLRASDAIAPIITRQAEAEASQISSHGTDLTASAAAAAVLRRTRSSAARSQGQAPAVQHGSSQPTDHPAVQHGSSQPTDHPAVQHGSSQPTDHPAVTEPCPHTLPVDMPPSAQQTDDVTSGSSSRAEKRRKQQEPRQSLRQEEDGKLRKKDVRTGSGNTSQGKSQRRARSQYENNATTELEDILHLGSDSHPLAAEVTTENTVGPGSGSHGVIPAAVTPLGTVVHAVSTQAHLTSAAGLLGQASAMSRDDRIHTVTSLPPSLPIAYPPSAVTMSVSTPVGSADAGSPSAAAAAAPVAMAPASTAASPTAAGGATAFVRLAMSAMLQLMNSTRSTTANSDMESRPSPPPVLTTQAQQQQQPGANAPPAGRDGDALRAEDSRDDGRRQRNRLLRTLWSLPPASTSPERNSADGPTASTSLGEAQLRPAQVGGRHVSIRRGRDADGPDDEGDRHGGAPSSSSSQGRRLGGAWRYDDSREEGSVEAHGSTTEGRGYMRCFEGHRNSSGANNVALMGQRSQFVVTCSDDGHLFVWDLSSGELLNMCPGAQGDHCVQAHPFDMTLASCGNDPIVRLWSPKGDEMARPTAEQKEVLTANLFTLSALTPPALQIPDLVQSNGVEGAARSGPDQPRASRLTGHTQRLDARPAVDETGGGGRRGFEEPEDEEEHEDEEEEHTERDGRARAPCHLM
ncbi:hypothetical protein CEUSTIGMA_g7466.t1 [Chlamydomonas eustigma]|uniref:Anaphase-promoting complex subunit 4 WD40 domain-containing protein n=1 Tax=Chlamydomonas eustigma TaxID=1157962 RepID=A0A250XAC3_9CHLO|nr:hypothetical protein CEUSTIGMA_g7466.t1 [Chlamydomonas eustigma]|eukprot:GAX80027.1 hypothetical protein CEUSTIGMA_g7466.t1 [Chlamydomonas eustigma]